MRHPLAAFTSLYWPIEQFTHEVWPGVEANEPSGQAGQSSWPVKLLKRPRSQLRQLDARPDAMALPTWQGRQSVLP